MSFAHEPTMTSERRVAGGRSFTVLTTVGAGLLGAYYAFGVVLERAKLGIGSPTYDLYGFFLPNTLYALRSFHEGNGLLWNRLQNCGQPFFADPQTALLYPPFDLCFGLLPPDLAVLVLMMVHLALAGIGMSYLCLELGLIPVAAFSGAITYELGGTALSLASWQPILISTYAWVPLALLLCERLVRAPAPRTALWLTLVLALQILAGFPQMCAFTYQCIVFRVAWALAAREAPSSAQTVLLLLVGLALPLFLTAAYVLPVVEFARESIRGAPLSASEVNILGTDWPKFRQFTDLRVMGFGTTFAVVPAALAGLLIARTDKRRPAWAYATLMVISLALAFDNPLSQFYHSLPLGSVFRGPDRFLWVTGFALSVVVAFGVDALAVSIARPSPPRRRVVVGLTLGAVGFYALCPSGFRTSEWTLLAITVVLCLGALMPSRFGRFPYWLVPLPIAANLVLQAVPFHRDLVDAMAAYRTHERAFTFVRQRISSADRMYQLGDIPDLAVMPKSASIFGVPSLSDYQPIVSSRYGEFYMKLILGPSPGTRLANINMLLWTNRMPANAALLNLAAARYVLVEASMDHAATGTGRPLLRKLADLDGVRIYENPYAFSRAFYVPSAAVIADPHALLDRLSSAAYDPRATVLLETPPADGFTGSPDGVGYAVIAEDRSEEVALDVRASRDGFLFLADQYYPGWTAIVNGTSTQVYRANHVFRAVRVPAGDSRVIFRYQPESLRIGIAISLLTLAGLTIYATRSFTRRRQAVG